MVKWPIRNYRKYIYSYYIYPLADGKNIQGALEAVQTYLSTEEKMETQLTILFGGIQALMRDSKWVLKGVTILFTMDDSNSVRMVFIDKAAWDDHSFFTRTFNGQLMQTLGYRIPSRSVRRIHLCYPLIEKIKKVVDSYMGASGIKGEDIEKVVNSFKKVSDIIGEDKDKGPCS